MYVKILRIAICLVTIIAIFSFASKKKLALQTQDNQLTTAEKKKAGNCYLMEKTWITGGHIKIDRMMVGWL